MEAYLSGADSGFYRDYNSFAQHRLRSHFVHGDSEDSGQPDPVFSDQILVYFADGLHNNHFDSSSTRVGRGLVGAGLAVAGVIFQGIFRNPMADPFAWSVTGASVGYAIAVLLGLTSALSLIGLGMAQILAFGFALLAVFFVVTISRVGGKIPTINMVLSGMVISIFLLAIQTVLELRSGKVLIGLVAWIPRRIF